MLINKALTSIMHRDSSPILLNVKAPPIGQRTDSSAPTLFGQKVSISHRVPPVEPDTKLQKFRYDSIYIPGNDKNIVSPMLSMKYNLSKEYVKLQNTFTTRL